MYNIRTQTGKCKTIYNIRTDIFWGDDRKDHLSFPHRQNAEKNVYTGEKHSIILSGIGFPTYCPDWFPVRTAARLRSRRALLS